MHVQYYMFGKLPTIDFRSKATVGLFVWRISYDADFFSFAFEGFYFKLGVASDLLWQWIVSNECLFLCAVRQFLSKGGVNYNKRTDVWMVLLNY